MDCQLRQWPLVTKACIAEGCWLRFGEILKDCKSFPKVTTIELGELEELERPGWLWRSGRGNGELGANPVKAKRRYGTVAKLERGTTLSR